MDKFPMHSAAELGDLEKVKQFVREGMSIDIPDDCKYTPLHSAAKRGHLEVSEFLISQKIDLDLKSEDGSTAAMVAAEAGHKSIVQLLLRSGEDVRCCSEIGKWSLLHHACRLGWTAIVKLLVEDINTDLNAKTSLSMTPILLAASEGYVDIVEILTKAGGYTDCRDINGWGVLHHACKKGWLHIVQQIVETKRANKNAVTGKLMRPVQLAASEGHKDIVEFLIEAGADVACDDGADSWTVLHYACKRGWLQIVKKILETAASCCINARIPENGSTPLHIACGMHHTEIIKELLEAGADAGITNADNECAFGGESLHDAALAGNLERVQHLLKLGVPINTRDRLGYTPLHRAAENQNDQLEVAKFLISNKCDLNPKDCNGYTPIMHAAVFNQNENLVNLLVESGADIDWSHKWSVEALLHTACEYDWEDTVKLLLQNAAKVDIDAKSFRGRTPLMYATEHEGCDIVRILLLAGANVSITDNVGDTALHHACEYGHAEMVKMFISAGADVNAQNRGNEKPLHSAVVAENQEVIKILIQHGAYLKNLDDYTISEHNPLRELVLKDVDLCARLIINKFNHQSLPMIYKNPEYAKRLPPMDKLCIGNTEGVPSAIEGYVESEIATNTFCNVTTVRPTVLTLMCVEALINPRSIKKERSACKVTRPVKRSARLAALNMPLAKKSSN